MELLYNIGLLVIEDIFCLKNQVYIESTDDFSFQFIILIS